MNNKKRISLINGFPIVAGAVCVVLAILFGVVGTSRIKFDGPMETTRYYDADFEWNDESGKSVSMPFSPQIKAGEMAYVTTTVPEGVEDNMVIFLRVDQLDIKVYVADELRLSCLTDDTRRIGIIPARRYLYMNLLEEDAGKELKIECFCKADGIGKIDALQYGLKQDITRMWIQENISDVLIALIMLIVSLLSLAAGIILSIAYKRFFEVIYLTVMGLLASIWILCNSEISQLILTNCAVSTVLDYMMLLLLPFPFLFFMNKMQKYHYNKIYLVFEYIVVVNVAVCTTLQMLNICDYVQVFPAIAGVFGCSLIMILITIAIDFFVRKDRSYIIVAIGITAGVVATLIQFVFFLGGFISFGGKTVGYALLIILFTTLIDTFLKVKNAELEKQIAVAQGKAESRFLANMSHEIRTPINAVLGMNEMILRETGEDGIREYSQSIETSGKMLLSIVNDILDFSKIRSGNMKILDVQYSLTKTVSDIKNMIAPRAMAKSLMFYVDVDNKLPDGLTGDDVRVKQIIINLLSNAVKYTDNGSIRLNIEGKSVSDEKAELIITVSDTGKGIREEDKESLFSAFTRVDEKNNRNIEGTGLGLALVSQLVTAMGGEIRVDSVYGKGSSFIVEIPQGVSDKTTVAEVLAKSENSVKKAEKSSEGNSALFKAPEAKVLVVDDTLVNLTVVKKLLKRTEISVDTASGGEKCLELLKKEKYDVILLDHLMPVMDGEETLKRIKSENLAEGTPVIMLTANAIEGSRERFLNMGFDDYISKPINPNELESMLMKYISDDKIITQ